MGILLFFIFIFVSASASATDGMETFKELFENQKIVTTKSHLNEKTNCLPNSLKVKLRKVERKFGKVTVISTFRKNAVVRKTGRPSLHRYCRAVDFHPRKGTYQQVIAWLKQNHTGGIGTYSGRFNHIHIDDGPSRRWHN